MSVALSEIQCVVMRYDKPACEELSQWLHIVGIDWRYGIGDYEIDVARNKNIQRFLKEDVPRGKKYLLMLNDDMVPLPETSPILYEDGDALYCGSMSSRATVEHIGDKQFSGACWRTSARLLQSFGPPWFRVGHSGDVCDRTYCDCNYFRDRINDAGWDAKMVGIVGHRTPIIIFPDPKDPQHTWRWVWPGQAPMPNGPILPPPPTAPQLPAPQASAPAPTPPRNYDTLCATPSPINEHLPTLRQYASQCEHVTEFGVDTVVSTWAFIESGAKTVRAYDLVLHPNTAAATARAVSKKVDLTFIQGNTLTVEIEPTDMLFIDTRHQYAQLGAELEKHASKARKFLAFHDVVTFGLADEPPPALQEQRQPAGLLPAIFKWLIVNPQWRVARFDTNNNGLLVLSRVPA